MAVGVNIVRDIDYQIKIKHNLLVKQNFRKYEASQLALITDKNIMKFHGKKFNNILTSQKADYRAIRIPSGEEAKTQFQVERIINILAVSGFDRDSIVFNFGGGSVSDVGGFAASRYLRGIRYVNIPTTLLAMVDAAIGGKVGVNTKEGKNMDGAFYHPVEVISDTSLLKTLPKKEWKNGLAEIVKYGISNDYQLFELLEKNPDSSEWGKGLLSNIIGTCAGIKARMVEEDELERKGLREVLNYGHTIGHAIEKVSDYEIPHGAAVGMGMNYEARIALKLGLLKRDEYERIADLLKRTELFASYDGDANKILDVMKKDKKNKAGQIRIVPPIRIGAVIKDKKQHSIPVSEKMVISVLKES